MELILAFLNTCWLFHKWDKRNGHFVPLRSADRRPGSGEMLLKDHNNGWLRYERRCKRCGMHQVLRATDDTGTQGEWETL